MRLLIATVFFVMSTSSVYSQCNCAENFEFVYSKLKLNYAGWRDKTTPDPQGFATFTEQHREKALSETNPNYCYRIIHDWLLYFKDAHTSLYSKSSATEFERKSAEEIRKHFYSSETILLTEQQLKEQIDLSNSIEGIWKNEAYMIAIIKNKNAYRDYVGVILKADSVYWMPGQVKLELKEISSERLDAMFFMRDHSMQISNATLAGNELHFKNLSSFTKMYPHVEAIKQTESLEKVSTQTELRKIDANTFYLRLPTFHHSVKPTLDSLLLVNNDRLIETPNLIIDVRDNGGGSDVTYSDVIQYLYTHKIKMINNSILSTPDNIAKFNAILHDPQYPKNNKPYIRKLVNELEAQPNIFYRKKDNTITLKRKLENPRKILVLANRGCGSSCEEFILTATQSSKVTVMGENTMGVLDYANVHTLDLPYRDWGLQYATSRTNRLPNYPIDNIGIEPNVKIPNDVNWIEFATEYLKTN